MGRSRNKQYREITFTELAKDAHTHASAMEALERYYRLQEAGKRPRIFHSRFHGYLVRDPLDEPVRSS